MNSNLKDLANQMKKILQPYNEIQRSLEPLQKLMETQKPILELQKQIEFLMKNIAPAFIPENPFLKYSEALVEIGKRLQDHIKNTPDHLLLIAEHGWFIDLDSEIYFPDIIVSEIKANNIEAAEQILIDYFTESKAIIFDALKNRHGDRAHIIEELEKLFDAEQYYSFIPQVFSQIDGICFDTTNKKFFLKNKKTYLPEVTDVLNATEGSVRDIYLSPLRKTSPIFAHEKELYRFPCKLNRHEIMHGVDTTYGNRTNALRVLSLLKYVSDLLFDHTLDKKKEI